MYILAHHRKFYCWDYLPPENSLLLIKLINEIDFNSFANETLSICSQNKYMFLLDDFNGRTSELSDCYVNDFFTLIKNQDHTLIYTQS